MTRAQECIEKWVNTQFESGSVKIMPIGDNQVSIKDNNGETMLLTCNLYCDIMDARSGNVLAKSDLPHGLDGISNQLPETWTNIPYSPQSRHRGR